MQPTDTQVACSLAALRISSEVDAAGVDQPRGGIPSGLLDDLLAKPSIRPERLAEAKARFVAGDHPSDQDLASRMVGRLVCDRLR